jgi:hypothetical protein
MKCFTVTTKMEKCTGGMENVKREKRKQIAALENPS